MYEAGGGECGDGDLMRILKDEEERPSSGAITHMCLSLGMEEDDYRTINIDDDWKYFYELLSKMADRMSVEELYDSLDSYMSPGEVEGHLNYIKKHKRKTA